MFTVENLTKSFEIFQEKIEANKQYLSDLDQAIGDGDHGNNMSRGITAVMNDLEAKQPEKVADIFKIAAMSLIGKVGGASGPLYGTSMMEMAKASMKEENTLNILQAGLAGIKKRGNSDVGQKTMIDLWEPALATAQTEALSAEQLQHYAQATKELVAKKGRASYLGERSVGHIDPGAVSSQYLFESFIEAGVFND